MGMFGPAFDGILEREGGLVLHRIPGDRGGLTFGGVSERANPNWEGWNRVAELGLQNGEKSRDPVLREMVADVYKERYWNRIRGTDIESLSVAEAMFDAAILQGPEWAVKTAQRILGLEVDGIPGTLTLNALNTLVWEDTGEDGSPELREQHFLALFALARCKFFALSAVRYPQNSKFLKGWILNRGLFGVEV